MVIIIDGNEIDTGWLIAIGAVAGVLLVLFFVFLGVMWHTANQIWDAAAQASDWFEDEKQRRNMHDATT